MAMSEKMCNLLLAPGIKSSRIEGSVAFGPREDASRLPVVVGWRVTI